MTEPLGTATVIVKPDTTGFRRELQTKMNALKPVTVPVAAAVVPTKFTKDLKSKMKTAAPIPVPVAASANVGAFSRDLRRKLKTAPISVPVAATITGATAAAGGLGAVQRESRAAAKATDEFSSSTKKATRSMGQLERGAGATGLSMLGVRGATLAASGAFLAGAAAITLFAKAVQSAVSLQQQLAVFQATTGATAAEMERVSAAARQMGQDITLPGISAGDAATAMTELAKAGLSVEDAIDGARGVLQLAIAANISFADATQLAASALNAFGLQGDEAVHVADVLANAANAAQGSIQDMGLALQQAAAVGRQVGLSLEDTTGFLTILAREGLRGSDAGTSLRVALGRLINPTAKIQAELDKLGVALRDANGNVRPDFFVNLGIAMKGMSKAQKDATLATLGGMDAMRALSILTRQNIDDLLGINRALNEQGTASDVASARMVGLTGAASNLSNTLQGIGIGLGSTVTPALTSFVNGINSAIVGARSLADALPAEATSQMGRFLVQMAEAAAIAVIAVKGLTTAVALLSRGFKAMQASAIAAWAAANPLGAAAVAIGITGLYIASTKAASATKQLAGALEETATATQNLATAQKAVASTRQDVRTQQLSIQQQEFAISVQKAALAQSDAAKSSLAYRQAANGLAVAEQQLRVSEQRLADLREELKVKTEEAVVAEENQQAAMAETVRTVQQLNREAAFAGRAGLFDNKQLALSVSLIEQQASAQRKINTEASRDLARRLQAIAALERRLGRLATESEINLILTTDDFEAGLRKVEAALRKSGEDGADGFADGVNTGLGKAEAGMFDWIYKDVPKIMVPGFEALGISAGAAFTNPIVGALSQLLAWVEAQIASAKARIAGLPVSPTLAQKIQVAQIGGDTATALNLSRRREAMFKRIAEAAKARGDEETYKKALDQWEAAHNETVALENEILANQKAGASAVKSAADDAQKALDDADQALLDTLQRKEARAQLKITAAENTKTLQDDIKAQVALRNLIKREILVVAARIHDENLRKDTILALRQALLETKGAIKDLYRQLQENRIEQKKAREAARKEREEALQESIRLDIELAETTGNVKNEIRARQRLIAALRKAQSHVKRGSVEWKRLRNEIEAEKKAIADLKKQTKDRNNEFAGLAFEFLQTQQGFAASIIGNLLPKSAVAGAVGGPGGGASGGPSAQVTARAQESSAAAQTTSRGQTASMIHILRQILLTLQAMDRNAKGAGSASAYAHGHGSAAFEAQ